MRVLGVNCKPGCAYLALAEGGEIVAGVTEWISTPALEESSDQLSAALEELTRVMTDARAKKVVLLKPEGGPKPTRTHSEFVPRIALETVVRLAAVRSGVEIEQLARPTVRKRLDLSQEGKLRTHVAACVPEKVGANWCEDRQFACLAALAGEVS